MMLDDDGQNPYIFLWFLSSIKCECPVGFGTRGPDRDEGLRVHHSELEFVRLSIIMSWICAEPGWACGQGDQLATEIENMCWHRTKNTTLNNWTFARTAAAPRIAKRIFFHCRR